MKVFSIDIPLYRSLILENISYTGYFLNSAEVSCTSTARTVGKKSAHASKSTPSGGGNGGTGGTGNGGGNGGSQSGGNGGNPTGGTGGQAGARGERGGGNNQTTPTAPSQPQTPTFTVSDGSDVAWGTMTTVGGYNPSDYSSAQVNAAMREYNTQHVTPAQIAASDVKVAEKKQFDRHQAYQAEQAQKRADQLAGVPQPDVTGYDPRTGYVGVDPSSVPSWLGGTKPQTPADSLRVPDVGRPDKDSVFGIGDSSYKTETQQDFAQQTSTVAEQLGFDFGVSTTPADIGAPVSQSIDFWGSQPEPSKQSGTMESQLNMLLAQVHIKNTTDDIVARQAELADLNATLDQERARMVEEKGAGFDSWSTATLYQESALYQATAERIERLEAELKRLEDYKDAEQIKYDKWSGMDITEATAAALTGGIQAPLDPNVVNIMDTAPDTTSPVVKGTLDYVDKTPVISDVIQSPADFGKIPDSDGDSWIKSIFGNLKAPFETPDAFAVEDPSIIPTDTDFDKDVFATAGLTAQETEQKIHPWTTVDPVIDAKAEEAKAATPNEEQYAAAKLLGLPVETYADLQAIEDRWSGEDGDKKMDAEVTAYGKEQVGLADLYVTSTQTDTDMDKALGDFADTHDMTKQEAAERYNTYVTDELGLGRDMVFSPAPYIMTGDLQAQFDQYQADAPEGMIFSGLDPYGKPKYGMYGQSELVIEADKSGYEDVWKPVTIDSDEGKWIQSGFITMAKSDFQNIVQKERHEDFTAGKYSMTEFLKYSGGDLGITERFMSERGLSMDAPVGSMSLTGGGLKIDPKTGEFERETVPLRQTLIEQGYTGRQLDQMSTDKDGNEIMHDVFKTIMRADDPSIQPAIPATTGAYTADAKLTDDPVLRELYGIKDEIPAVESPYIKDRVAYDDPMARLGVGMTTLAKEKTVLWEDPDTGRKIYGATPYHQTTAADMAESITSQILGEYADEEFSLMWKLPADTFSGSVGAVIGEAYAEDEVGVKVSREEFLPTLIAGLSEGKQLTNILSASMKDEFDKLQPRESPEKYAGYVEFISEKMALPPAELYTSTGILKFEGATDTEYTTADREFWLTGTPETGFTFTEAATVEMKTQGLLITQEEWAKQFEALPADSPYKKRELAIAQVASMEAYPKAWTEAYAPKPEPVKLPMVSFGFTGAFAMGGGVSMPTLDVLPAKQFEAVMEFGKFLSEPLTYLFKQDIEWTDEGKLAFQEGRLGGNLAKFGDLDERGGISATGIGAPTYHELADMGYIKRDRDDFIGELKYYVSAGLHPMVNIGRMIGMVSGAAGEPQGYTTPSIIARRVAAGIEDPEFGVPKYAIYDATFLEMGMGSLIEQAQHSIDVASGKAAEEIEARPFITVKEGQDVFGDWTGVEGATHGEGFSGSGWGELGEAERADQGTFNELVQKFQADPLKMAVQLPMEAGLMLIPIKIRPVIMAGLMAGAKVTSKTATAVLPTTKVALKNKWFGKDVTTLDTTAMNKLEVARLLAKDPNLKRTDKEFLQKTGLMKSDAEIKKIIDDAAKAKLKKVVPQQLDKTTGKILVQGSIDGIKATKKEIDNVISARKYASKQDFLDEAYYKSQTSTRSKIFGTVVEDIIEGSPQKGWFARRSTGGDKLPTDYMMEPSGAMPSSFTRVVQAPMKRAFTGGQWMGIKVPKLGQKLQRIADFTPERMSDYLQGGWMYNWKFYKAGDLIHRSRLARFLEAKWEAVPESTKLALKPVTDATTALHLTMSSSARFARVLDDLVRDKGAISFQKSDVGQALMKKAGISKLPQKKVYQPRSTYADEKGMIPVWEKNLIGQYKIQLSTKQKLKMKKAGDYGKPVINEATGMVTFTSQSGKVIRGKLVGVYQTKDLIKGKWRWMTQERQTRQQLGFEIKEYKDLPLPMRGLESKGILAGFGGKPSASSLKTPKQLVDDLQQPTMPKGFELRHAPLETKTEIAKRLYGKTLLQLDAPIDTLQSLATFGKVAKKKQFSVERARVDAEYLRQQKLAEPAKSYYVTGKPKTPSLEELAKKQFNDPNHPKVVQAIKDNKKVWKVLSKDEQAVIRRMKEELGMRVKPKGVFEYIDTSSGGRKVQKWVTEEGDTIVGFETMVGGRTTTMWKKLDIGQSVLPSDVSEAGIATIARGFAGTEGGRTIEALGRTYGGLSADYAHFTQKKIAVYKKNPDGSRGAFSHWKEDKQASTYGSDLVDRIVRDPSRTSATEWSADIAQPFWSTLTNTQKVSFLKRVMETEKMEVLMEPPTGKSYMQEVPIDESILVHPSGGHRSYGYFENMIASQTDVSPLKSAKRINAAADDLLRMVDIRAPTHAPFGLKQPDFIGTTPVPTATLGITTVRVKPFVYEGKTITSFTFPKQVGAMPKTGLADVTTTFEVKGGLSLTGQPATTARPVDPATIFKRVKVDRPIGLGIDTKAMKIYEALPSMGRFQTDSWHQITGSVYQTSGLMKIHAVAYGRTGLGSVSDLIGRMEPVMKKWGITRKYAASKEQLEQLEAGQFAKGKQGQQGKAMTAYIPDEIAFDPIKSQQIMDDIARALEGYTPASKSTSKRVWVEGKTTKTWVKGKLNAKEQSEYDFILATIAKSQKYGGEVGVAKAEKLLNDMTSGKFKPDDYGGVPMYAFDDAIRPAHMAKPTVGVKWSPDAKKPIDEQMMLFNKIGGYEGLGETGKFNILLAERDSILHNAGFKSLKEGEKHFAEQASTAGRYKTVKEKGHYETVTTSDRDITTWGTVPTDKPLAGIKYVGYRWETSEAGLYRSAKWDKTKNQWMEVETYKGSDIPTGKVYVAMPDYIKYKGKKVDDPYAKWEPNYGFQEVYAATDGGSGIPNLFDETFAGQTSTLKENSDKIFAIMGRGMTFAEVTEKIAKGSLPDFGHLKGADIGLEVVGGRIEPTTVKITKYGEIDKSADPFWWTKETKVVVSGRGRDARIAAGTAALDDFKAFTKLITKDKVTMENSLGNNIAAQERFVTLLKVDKQKLQQAHKYAEDSLKELQKNKNSTTKAKESQGKLVDEAKEALDDGEKKLKHHILKLDEMRFTKTAQEKLEKDVYGGINYVAEIFYPRKPHGTMPSSAALTPLERFYYRTEYSPYKSAKYESQIKNVLETMSGTGSKAIGYIPKKAPVELSKATKYSIAYKDKEVQYKNLMFGGVDGTKLKRLSKAERAEANKLEQELMEYKAGWGDIVGYEKIMKDEAVDLLAEPVSYGSGVMYRLLTPALKAQKHTAPLTRASYGGFHDDFGSGRTDPSFDPSITPIEHATEALGYNPFSNTPAGGIYKGEYFDLMSKQTGEHVDEYTKGAYQDVFGGGSDKPTEAWVGDIYLMEDHVGKSWYKPPQMYFKLIKYDAPKDIFKSATVMHAPIEQQEAWISQGLLHMGDGDAKYVYGKGANLGGVPLDLGRMKKSWDEGDYETLWIKADDTLTEDLNTEFLQVYTDNLQLSHLIGKGQEGSPIFSSGKYGIGKGQMDLVTAEYVHKEVKENIISKGSFIKGKYTGKGGKPTEDNIVAEIDRIATDPNHPLYGKYGYGRIDKDGSRVFEQTVAGKAGLWEGYGLDKTSRDTQKHITRLYNRIEGYVETNVHSGNGRWVSKSDLEGGNPELTSWWNRLSSENPAVLKKAEEEYGWTKSDVNSHFRKEMKTGEQFWLGEKYPEIPQFINQEKYTAAEAHAINVKRGYKTDSKYDGSIMFLREGDVIPLSGDLNPKYVAIQKEIQSLKKSEGVFKKYVEFEEYLQKALRVGDENFGTTALGDVGLAKVTVRDSDGRLVKVAGLMERRLKGEEISDKDLLAEIGYLNPQELDRFASFRLTDDEIGMIRANPLLEDRSTPFRRNDSIWDNRGHGDQGVKRVNAELVKLIEISRRAWSPKESIRPANAGLHQDYALILREYFEEVRWWKANTKLVGGTRILKPSKIEGTVKRELVRRLNSIDPNSDAGAVAKNDLNKFNADTKYNEQLWINEAKARRILTQQRNDGEITEAKFQVQNYNLELETKSKFRDVSFVDAHMSNYKGGFVKDWEVGGSVRYQQIKTKSTPDDFIFGSTKGDIERKHYKMIHDKWNQWNSQQEYIRYLEVVHGKPKQLRTKGESADLAEYLEKNGITMEKEANKEFWKGKLAKPEPMVSVQKINDKLNKRYFGGRLNTKEDIWYDVPDTKGKMSASEIHYRESGGTHEYWRSSFIKIKEKVDRPPATTLDWQFSPNTRNIVPWTPKKTDAYGRWKTRRALYGGTQFAFEGKAVVTKTMKDDLITQQARAFDGQESAVEHLAEMKKRVLDGSTIARHAAAYAEDQRMPQHPQLLANLEEHTKQVKGKDLERLAELDKSIAKYKTEKSDADDLWNEKNRQFNDADVKKNQAMDNLDGDLVVPSKYKGEYETTKNRLGQVVYEKDTTGQYIYTVKKERVPEREPIMDITLDGKRVESGRYQDVRDASGNPKYIMQKVKNPKYADYIKAKTEWDVANKELKQATRNSEKAEANWKAEEMNRVALEGKLAKQGFVKPEDMMQKLVDVLEKHKGSPYKQRKEAYFNEMDRMQAQIFGHLKSNFDEQGKFKNAVYSDIYKEVPILKDTDPFGFMGYTTKGESGSIKWVHQKAGNAFDMQENMIKALDTVDGGWEKLANTFLRGQEDPLLKGTAYKALSQNPEGWNAMYDMLTQANWKGGRLETFIVSEQKRTLIEIKELEKSLLTLQKGDKVQNYMRIQATKDNIAKKKAFLKSKDKQLDMIIESRSKSETWLVELNKNTKHMKKSGTISKLLEAKRNVKAAEERLDTATAKYQQATNQRLEFEIKYNLQEKAKGEGVEETIVKGVKDVGDEGDGLSSFQTGLGDTTFVVQEVKISAKAFSNNIYGYMDWMHGRGKLPELVEPTMEGKLERGIKTLTNTASQLAGKFRTKMDVEDPNPSYKDVGSDFLPQTSTGTVYKVNRIFTDTGKVPFIDRREELPFFVNIVQRITRRDIPLENLQTPYGKTMTVTEVENILKLQRDTTAAKMYGVLYEKLSPYKKMRIDKSENAAGVQDILATMDKVKKMKASEGRGEWVLNEMQTSLNKGMPIYSFRPLGGIGGTEKISIAHPAAMSTFLHRQLGHKTGVMGSMVMRSPTKEMLDEAVVKLVSSRVQQGFMGGLYKLGGFWNYPVGFSKFARRWKTTKHQYKRKERYDDVEAGQGGITVDHVQQVENEMGFSLRPYAEHIRNILKEGEVIKKSDTWSQADYDRYYNAINDMDFRVIIGQAIQQNIPHRAKILLATETFRNRITYSINKIWVPKKYHRASNVLDEIDLVNNRLVVHDLTRRAAEIKLAKAQHVVTKSMDPDDAAELVRAQEKYDKALKAYETSGKSDIAKDRFDLATGEYNAKWIEVTKKWANEKKKAANRPEDVVSGFDKMSLKERDNIRQIFKEVDQAREELSSAKNSQEMWQRRLDQKEEDFRTLRQTRPSEFDEWLIEHHINKQTLPSGTIRRRLFPDINVKKWDDRLEQYDKAKARQQLVEPETTEKAVVKSPDWRDQQATVKEKAVQDYLVNQQKLAHAQGIGLYDLYTVTYPPAFAGTMISQQMEKMKLLQQGQVAQFGLPTASGESEGTVLGSEAIPTGQEGVVGIGNIPQIKPTVTDEIQNILAQINAQVTTPALNTAQATKTGLTSATQFGFGTVYAPALDTAFKQTTRQTPALATAAPPTTMMRTTLRETPFMRTWFPPAMTMPMFPQFPTYRRRPRMTPPVRGKWRKIWWDVPSQPLGEPWAAQEYKVFGVAGQEGEPLSVKKKEFEKDLDAHPFGMGYEDDLKFWKQDTQMRTGFTMQRPKTGRKTNRGKAQRAPSHKPPWKRKKPLKFPDSDVGWG